MPVIVLICGLMQSGKTTVMAALARALVNERGLRVSVLVSGEIESGCDVALSPGVQPHALNGSCVSCQLGEVLAETVQRIRERDLPDILLVELSPTTEIDVARAALRNACGARDETVRAVVVVDVCAPQRLHQALDHLFGAMVLASDALVLNRAGRCSSESIRSVLEQVRRLNSAIMTVPLASADDVGAADVSALIDILSL